MTTKTTSPSPLPWRITDATEKKGREIVDSRGATVAKLTALDMPNAELIVSAVNPPKETIKHLVHHDELIVGREYWLVAKYNDNVKIAVCNVDSGRLYFLERLWATLENNQVMQFYDVFGPLPIREEPDFGALMEKRW